MALQIEAPMEHLPAPPRAANLFDEVDRLAGKGDGGWCWCRAFRPGGSSLGNSRRWAGDFLGGGTLPPGTNVLGHEEELVSFDRDLELWVLATDDAHHADEHIGVDWRGQ